MLLSARYVLPVTGPVIVDGAVLVRDGRIRDIGDVDQLRLRYPDESWTSYGLAAIMPGLVNLNSMLENVAIRGIIDDVAYASWIKELRRHNREMERGDLFDSAMVGCMDAIASGITCIADISTTGAVFDAMCALGLRGVVYRRVAALDRSRVEPALEAAARDIEQWQQKLVDEEIRGVSVGISPAPSFSTHPAMYGRVADYAREANLPVAMRLASSLEEVNFVKYGSSPFAIEAIEEETTYVEVPPWLPTGVSPVRNADQWGAFDAPDVMVIDAVKVDGDDIRILRDRDVGICHSPRANAHLGKGVAPLNEFLRARLRVGLGTDSPAATNSIDMLSEMRVGLLLARALNSRHFLDAATMIEMATIGGARVLRLEDEIGSLEVGKRADMIAVDLSSSHQATTSNPISAIVNTCTSTDVLFTMIDGRMLYENRSWKGDVEVAHHIARVIEIRSRLRSR